MKRKKIDVSFINEYLWNSIKHTKIEAHMVNHMLMGVQSSLDFF